MIENLKQNVKNKTWWVAIISTLIVLCNLWGLDLTKYIGVDWENTVNTICTLLVLLGICHDTTTPTLYGGKNIIEPESIQITTKEGINSNIPLEPQEVPTVTETDVVNQNKINQILSILNN